MNQIIRKELVLLKDLGMKYPKETSKKKKRYGLYKCHCGKEFETIISDVKSGRVSSCGCLKNTHNLSNHRLYQTWNGMMQRCNNPKRKEYKDYGGRGISVCDRWLDMENFINDMYPSYKEGLTIDRRDSNGNYEKANCRWTIRSIQSRNTRVLMSTNTSGYRGVHWHKVSKKWISEIRVDSKKIYIGSFDTAIDGAVAYDKYIIDNNLEHTLNFK